MSAPDLTRTALAAELLGDASQRLVRSVDALPEEGWPGPSLLPGWTRLHVLAHLTCNAEALAAVLRGLAAGEALPMYPSQERRDADIEEAAALGASELRTRFLGATTEFADAVAGVPEDAWDREVERVPGGPTFVAAAVPEMRLREVEIHHVDLAAGPTHTDWSPGFAALVLDAMSSRPRGPHGLTADPTDLDRTWTYDEGGPVVTGTAADLAWWLTGRGRGEGLTSETGTLPEIGAW
ncbi:maleylpyruvate isomerase family mycothiol-dependent enzyme [Nocardioides sp. KIGAM211]|uniref:Maleylpyruvate isomerase family mycothiol-dependent enzyme n=1 Tax=Nocardioides luti TaxID=2761101 RepID=A0A7X0RFB6_9ACTN|nr:maleylpyruvate isomerase family mycothiol-dependent enzyme [Nocardioides luti]MBB6625969.1 maleylpyruvate isomerase family mycothiol-dependent enzyme [Nocardioides luti]